MIKLIIVDDERAASELIVSCLKKSGLDIEISGIFENGNDALEFMNKNSIDIVMTDIKMPEIDGLDFAKILSEKYPAVKVVIFSGYNEFEFAKRALIYGVSDYLLKPVNLKELFLCIKKLSLQIEEERTNKKIGYPPEMQEEFLNDMLMGVITDFDEYTKRFNAVSFPFSKENSGGVMLMADCMESDVYDEWKYGRNTLSTAIINIIEKNTHNCHVYSMGISQKSIKLVCIGKKQLIDVDLIISEAKKELKLNLRIEMLLEFKNLWDMSLVYSKRVTKAEKFSFLISQVVLGNKVNADNMLKDIMKDEKKEDKGKFISQLKGLLNIDVNSSDSTAEALMKNENISDDDDVVIKKARAYISKNYMNDLTRDDVAEHVFMNSSYFSRYFNQKMGISFYDYLVKIRMEKAKELLMTRKKISEIGKKTGYQYPKYFIKNFKRYTGYTPSDYRKFVLKIEESLNEED